MNLELSCRGGAGWVEQYALSECESARKICIIRIRVGSEICIFRRKSEQQKIFHRELGWNSDGKICNLSSRKYTFRPYTSKTIHRYKHATHDKRSSFSRERKWQATKTSCLPVRLRKRERAEIEEKKRVQSLTMLLVFHWKPSTDCLFN